MQRNCTHICPSPVHVKWMARLSLSPNWHSPPNPSRGTTRVSQWNTNGPRCTDSWAEAHCDMSTRSTDCKLHANIHTPCGYALSSNTVSIHAGQADAMACTADRALLACSWGKLVLLRSKAISTPLKRPQCLDEHEYGPAQEAQSTLIATPRGACSSPGLLP
jgi:hypothetical protein